MTEHVQWGADLVFKVGGKMFAVLALEPGEVCMSFKTSQEDFAELLEHPGVVHAPYLARAQWVALETPEALPRTQLLRLVTRSYEIVFAKLPAKLKAQVAKAARSKKPVTRKTAPKHRAN